jgi:hypothetical protein
MTIPFDELWQEKEKRRYAPAWDTHTNEELLEGFEAFCAEVWHIHHPARGKILFKLSDAQRETAGDWLNNRYTIILKARQLGFSTLAGAFCVWATYFYDSRRVVMLSKGEREAIELLNKAKYGFKNLPEWMLQTGPVWDVNKTKLSFSNESGIESLPSGSEPARGLSLWLCILDEWAFLPNPEGAWASIEATVDLGGRVIGLSTANGEGNIFYKFWSKSKNYGSGDSQWFGIFHPWWADGAGVRDQEWYDGKKRELFDWQLAQEYPDNPDEAFVRSGRPVFELEHLRTIEPPVPAISVGELLSGGTHGPYSVSNDPYGPLTVYEAPKPSGVYVIGADVAEGLEHGDYSVAQVVDVRSNKQVAVWHGHCPPDEFGENILNNLGKYYGNCLIGVESNNHGISTLKGLRDAKYPTLFMERAHGKRQATPGERYGFRTTQTSKPLIIDELGGMIRNQTLWIPDPKTRHELRTFVRDGDRKMRGSPYDDRTMSLAIAVWMMQFAFEPQYDAKQEPGPGTIGFFEKMMSKKKKNSSHQIGAHSAR